MIVRASSLNRRLQTAVGTLQGDIKVPAGLYRGCDVSGCLRRGALDSRVSIPYDPEREKWMSLIGSSETFSVVKSRVSLSDVEARLFSYIDLVVRTSGELLLVLLRPHELNLDAPLNGDVFDMASAMYLSGIHSGFIIYFSEEKFVSFFVNPDQKTYKELLEVIISGSRKIYVSELRGQLPEANPGKLCKRCPHKEKCAVSAHGGQSGGSDHSSGEDKSGDRSQEGK